LNVAFAKIALEGGNRLRVPTREPQQIRDRYADHPERAA